MEKLTFIKTQGTNLSNNELAALINYAIDKIGYSLYKYDEYKLNNYEEKIINHYHELCSRLKRDFVEGEMDSFLCAACLAISCYVIGVFDDMAPTKDNFSKVNAMVAAEAALALIEEPYYYVGQKCDERVAAQSCDFEEDFKDNKVFFEDRKEAIVQGLMFSGEANSPFFLSDNLYMIYQLALMHQEERENKENKNSENSLVGNKKLFQKLLSPKR